MKAGTHYFTQSWILACAGMTNQWRYTSILLHRILLCYTVKQEMVWLKRR